MKAPGDDQRNFVRFNSKMMMEGRLVQIIGFAHPAILFELGGTKLHGFADATFDVVPFGFSQLLIIMMYFSRYDMYVPVYFILMQVCICIRIHLCICYTSLLSLDTHIAHRGRSRRPIGSHYLV